MGNELTPPIREVNLENNSSSTPWMGALAGSGAFLLYGGFTILQFSRPFRPVYPWFNGFDTVIFWIPVLLSFGMVTLGWTQNFPRWSYPYVTMSLLFTVVLCFSSPAGFLPLLFAVALALLITRSTRPLFHLVDQGLQDWTVFAFGAFGTLPFWMEAFCDLADPAPTLPWLIALTLFMAGIALAYLRSPHFRGRSLAIRAGLFLTGIAFVVGPDPFRYKIDWAYIVLMIFAVTILLMVLLFPALLAKLIRLWTRTQSDSSL